MDDTGQVLIAWCGHGAGAGNLQVLERLLVMGESIFRADINSWTPLMWAAAGGHVAVIQRLLVGGAALGICDKHGQGVLHVSASKGHLEAVSTLVDALAAQKLDLHSPVRFEPQIAACLSIPILCVVRESLSLQQARPRRATRLSLQGPCGSRQHISRHMGTYGYSHSWTVFGTVLLMSPCDDLLYEARSWSGLQDWNSNSSVQGCAQEVESLRSP